MHRREILKLGLLAVPVCYGFNSDLNFVADTKTDCQVINAGVGGNNTSDLLSRIEQDCLRHKPKLTILMIGTNDMNSVKYLPIDQYEANLNTLIKKIKDKGSKLLLMSILPVYEPDLLTRHPASFYEPEGVGGRRKQLNGVVKKAARKHRIHFLDLGHRFSAIGKIGTDKDSLLQNMANSNKRDGIHPTAMGYRFIGLAVYDYIVDHNLPKTQIVCFGDSITKGDGTLDRDSYPAYLQQLLKQSTL